MPEKARATLSALVCCFTDSYGRFGAGAAIEHVREAGLDAVELPIRSGDQPSRFGERPLLTSQSGLSELNHLDGLLQRHGVWIASCDVTGGDPLDPAHVEQVKKKIDIAAHFGVPSVVGTGGQAEEPDDLERLYAHLRDIGDYAGARGITYCLETKPGLCQNHYKMQETMAALAHPHVRASFDTANVYYYNVKIEGEIALAKVCHLVQHVRLKDTRGDFGRWNFPALGRGGAVDFVRVLQIMRGCGFRGPFSIAVEGVAGEPELPLDGHHARIVESVEQLRHCGFFD